MSTAPRMVVALSVAAILAAATPAANAASQNVPPEPVGSCQDAAESYTRALAEIHAMERHATPTEKRTLHLELVELRRDRDLEPSPC